MQDNSQSDRVTLFTDDPQTGVRRGVAERVGRGGVGDEGGVRAAVRTGGSDRADSERLRVER